jgi:CubicO group peptidase (beta-lactamase class C family)
MRAGRLPILASLVLAAAPARAQTALDSVDRYVRAELARQRVPGMSVAVLRGDSVLLAHCYCFS